MSLDKRVVDIDMKPKIEIPEYLKGHKELAGICVEGCIYNGKWSKGQRIKDTDGNYIKRNGKYVREPPASAHAHTDGHYKGWICFRTLKDLNKETTCKHELAHIITGEGHTKKWAEKYVELQTPKWLTVDWLQRKYGFDDAGNEGGKLLSDMLKLLGIDKKEKAK